MNEVTFEAYACHICAAIDFNFFCMISKKFKVLVKLIRYIKKTRCM
jgi:hypothetical protein